MITVNTNEYKIFRSLFNQGGFSDNVFLSAYPLPCFITYSKETQKLKTYDNFSKFQDLS